MMANPGFPNQPVRASVYSASNTSNGSLEALVEAASRAAALLAFETDLCLGPLTRKNCFNNSHLPVITASRKHEMAKVKQLVGS